MRAREEARAAWRKNYRTEPLPVVLDCIASWRGRFREGVISEAVNMAALRGAASPVDYVITLLKDWSIHGLRTAEDVDEYIDSS